MQKQLRDLWAYVEQVYQDEEQSPNPPDFDDIDPDKVERTIEQINGALADKPIDKKIKQKLNYAKRHWPANLRKYQRQEAQLGKRNSMSKTDPDTLTADAGYGSEGNYTHLEKKGVEAFVKYSYFHKDQLDKKRGKLNPFAPDNLHYNPSTDTYYCPMGQAMEKSREHKQKTKRGFSQTIHSYQAQNCQGCNLRSQCHKARGNRIIQRNHNLIRHKHKAREKLTSEQGIKHRKQRCWDVEAVFGNIKQNMNFKKFMLRGLDKVSIETGLIAIAHNLKKVSIK